MIKGCFWIGIGALVLFVIILIAAWPSESTYWCNSESDVGDCKFEEGDNVCYCIDTFPENSTLENLNITFNIYNAAKLRCERMEGTLATVEENNAVLQSLGRRMFQMGVDKALVALRRLDSGWFWLKENGNAVEYREIIWRFSPDPEHKQAMINVETIKTPADQYEYNWNYYNYDHYREKDKGYVWYGFSTCDDTLDKDAYYICQYNRGCTSRKKATSRNCVVECNECVCHSNTSEEQTISTTEYVPPNIDPCFCADNTPINLFAVDDSATFHTPGYPNNYCSDNYCRWSITVPEGLAIQLDFLVFSLEKNMDYVYIYEGLERDSPLLQTCTALKCVDLKSSGHRLQVLFHADHITTDLGFKARVMAVETDVCYCSASLTVELTNHLDSYTLVSPGYPEPYCPLHACGWTIRVEEPLELLVSFEEFDLGLGDYLSFFKDDGSLFQKCTNGKQCEIVFPEVSKLTIHFNSSEATERTHMGFQGSVMALDNYCERVQEGLGYTVAYTKERQDGNIPPGAQATITCEESYKVYGTFDTTSDVILCESPVAKWQKYIVCVEVCTVPDETAAEDLESIHLCETRFEPRDKIHNLTVQQYNFNEKTSKYQEYTCIDHSWTPTNLICHNMTNFKILVLGGIDPNGRSMETYHPSKPVNNKPLDAKLMQDREGAVGARLSDGSVLIAGGHTFPKIIHWSCELFWPDTLASTECASLNHARMFAAAALLDGILYVCGGCNNNDVGYAPVVLDSCEIYSEERTWETLSATMLSERLNFGLVALDGFLYAIGGENDMYSPLNSVDRYDPITEEWVPVAPMNVRRGKVQVAGLWRKLFVCNYENLAEGKETSRCESYDPAEDTWVYIATLSGAFENKYQSYVMVALDTLYVLAGGSGFNEVVKYDRKTDNWVPVQALVRERKFSSAVVIP